jgi:hypothetical protein
MKILAIDPGPEQSAYAILHEDGRVQANIMSNGDLLGAITPEYGSPGYALVIEMIASYGMPVGAEVFETAFWIGKFAQRWEDSNPFEYAARIKRKEVVLHLCNNPRGSDANVRAALIDRFGPGKGRAIGKKAAPGPLYGIKKDEWAALAVAVTYADQQAVKEKI